MIELPSRATRLQRAVSPHSLIAIAIVLLGLLAAVLVVRSATAGLNAEPDDERET